MIDPDDILEEATIDLYEDALAMGFSRAVAVDLAKGSDPSVFTMFEKKEKKHECTEIKPFKHS